jgi:predicted TIM-barrel fold metal-dependent hydrolase
MAPPETPAAGLIDVHCHLAALPTPGNGCRMSRKMLRGPLLRATAWAEGYPLEDPERTNALYLEKLLGRLSASTRVSRAVLLALDGAYGADGRLDEARTSMLISNDAVFSACAASGGKLLPGASVNPARRDALEELERCAAKGAVLIKVLPNAQGFDPGQQRYEAFYRALARLRLPLLSHIGAEFSVASEDGHQDLGEPGRLERALDAGAAVIAAHGCSSGRLFGSLFSEPHLETALRLAWRHPRFFMDASALTLPNRVAMAVRLARQPALQERLLFGTDYPLVVCWPGSNYFDRGAAALEALGLRCGADPAAVLRLPT